MTQSDLKEKLTQEKREEQRQSRIDYATTAFMLKKPYSSSIHKGPMLVAGRDAHRQLLEIARARGLYVWYAAVREVNGQRCAVEPHLVDWDSLPEPGEKPGEKSRGISKSDLRDDQPQHVGIGAADNPMKCRLCGQVCHSTSGLTLHYNAAHRDVLGADAGTQAVASGPAVLVCPDCGQVCSSTSGLTLHRKKHGGDNVGTN